MGENYRKDRIERLLNELQYEVTRGMMEREIDECLTFQFVVPVSQAVPDGIVLCSFTTKPTHRAYAPNERTALRVVK